LGSVIEKYVYCDGCGKTSTELGLSGSVDWLRRQLEILGWYNRGNRDFCCDCRDEHVNMY